MDCDDTSKALISAKPNESHGENKRGGSGSDENECDDTSKELKSAKPNEAHVQEIIDITECDDTSKANLDNNESMDVEGFNNIVNLTIDTDHFSLNKEDIISPKDIQIQEVIDLSSPLFQTDHSQNSKLEMSLESCSSLNSNAKKEASSFANLKKSYEYKSIGLSPNFSRNYLTNININRHCIPNVKLISETK